MKSRAPESELSVVEQSVCHCRPGLGLILLNTYYNSWLCCKWEGGLMLESKGGLRKNNSK